MKKFRGQVWLGVLFVILGALLILKNFGIINIGVWGLLWRMWPLILVLIGLEMMVKNRIAREIIFLIFVLIILAFVLVGIKRGYRFGRKSFEFRDMEGSPSTQLTDSFLIAAKGDTVAQFQLREKLDKIENLEISAEKFRDLKIFISEGEPGILEANLIILKSETPFYPDSLEFYASKSSKAIKLSISDKRKFWENKDLQWKDYEGGWKGELWVKVPSGISLSLSNVNGNLEIRDLTLKDLNLDLTNGSVYLIGLKVNETDGGSTNGSLRIEGSSGVEFNLETTNGNIYVKDLMADEKLSLESTNGSLSIENLRGLKIMLETTNGGIQIGSLQGKEILLESVNGGITIEKVSDFEKLSAKTTNGGIRAKVDENWLTGRAELSTNIGSINLTNSGNADVPIYIEDGKVKGYGRFSLATASRANIILSVGLGLVYLE